MRCNSIIILEDFQGSQTLGKFIQLNVLTILECNEIARELITTIHLLFKYKTPKVAHLDLNPNNIMVRRNGNKFEVKLIDFGIAKIYNHQDYSDLIFENFTPDYFAPEMLNRSFIQALTR